MPAVHHKLLLEEALQDSPQTRSLLSVFEEDSGMLTDYTNKLLQSMQRVFGAQSEMGLATEQLSQQLLEYEKKNFALGKGDEEVITTLQSFAKTVGELNSLHSELANQMADSMVFPLIQFREKDLTEISTLKEIFGIATDEHEAAMVKYSRLPKKKENEKLKADLVKEVAYTRRKQHQASLQYYCALNALQYRKRVAMLEPMLGYTQAQISFFKKGIELVSKKMDNFLSSVSNMTQSIQAQLDTEAEAMRAAQRELLSVEDTVYMPDKDTEPVNRTLIQKAGYLNIRNKTGLVTTAWDRLYFFTQGGNLMCQPRGAVAGGMVLDLDNSSVMAVECEDRRYCFQITSPSGKTSMILQAESKKEYEEWICTVNNISRQIYLTDNPEAVAIRLNQTAIQAVTPITSFEKRQEGSPNPDRAKPGGVHATSSGSQKSGAAPEPEDLIAPGTPIQFDIMLPASEFQDQNRAGGRRTNPFGETDDDCSTESDDSLLQQVFAVRFLGSMAVRCGDNQEVIYEAMRQVLAARAIHNIFRTTESHLMVTSSNLRLIDPQTQVTRISFQLGEVCQFAAHQENGRLMGFVVEGRDWSDGDEEGEPSFSAFVFESNTEGEKICYTISLAKDITEAKKDPEALAQLMKNMPLTNDGKFLLLEPETGDITNGAGQEDLESEA
ncbi:DCC-interacting protein 13-beta isoform X8 [Lates calcarifer]|uniref:DCC-interacting protein 13-beta n=1 Tax=Lates calcarifer TaxID=8187 RepID=A0AAJ7LVB0_LATCA|nr:DCC-interacting protein 13-beta isoform X1 [Lates calcarifer]XP_050929172.1 DCC-interacting protein 13-beta isoform X2 [Lates calcarifer]XP_050929173.1 DCC-interacting protein 13-beta isoform X3 [Lates calcarifer]XP_050929174.1 DCC-interacting protein 13-beta isoform X4 [Lates calcarifer]XP_050929175.1 DCC-interacting protein 13-beta isoform X5 [Lates calcarifer]XP_050929176.1 DCC-interacting protein 13-beta isoform X6 [Lates calcarifer]XP_050929177.1 DCC-interacting protein 13-beta isofor